MNKNIERFDLTTKLKQKEEELNKILERASALKEEKRILESQLKAVPVVVSGWYSIHEDEDKSHFPPICLVKKVVIPRKKYDSVLRISGVVIYDNYFESPVKDCILIEGGKRVDRRSIYSILEEDNVITTYNYNLSPITELEILIRYGFNPQEVLKLIKKEEMTYFTSHIGKLVRVVGFVQEDMDKLFSIW